MLREPFENRIEPPHKSSVRNKQNVIHSARDFLHSIHCSSARAFFNGSTNRPGPRSCNAATPFRILQNVVATISPSSPGFAGLPSPFRISQIPNSGLTCKFPHSQVDMNAPVSVEAYWLNTLHPNDVPTSCRSASYKVSALVIMAPG